MDSLWIFNLNYLFCFMINTDKHPRISMWRGKVNQHNKNGIWKTDPDGVSGANLDKLEYCKKFWPDTTKIQTSASERIIFHDRGNIKAYWSTKPVWLCVQENIGKFIHGLLVEMFPANSFYMHHKHTEHHRPATPHIYVVGQGKPAQREWCLED